MRFRFHLFPLIAVLPLVAGACRRDSEAPRRDDTATLTSATITPAAPAPASWTGSYEFIESTGKGEAKMGTLEEIGDTDYTITIAGEAASPRVFVTSTGVRTVKIEGRGVPRGDVMGVVFERTLPGHVASGMPALAKGDEMFSLKRSGDAVSLAFAKLPPTGPQKTLSRAPARVAPAASSCKQRFVWKDAGGLADSKLVDVVGTVEKRTVGKKKVFFIVPEGALCSPKGEVVRELAIDKPLADMEMLEGVLAELPLVIHHARSEEEPAEWVGVLETQVSSAYMLRVMDH
jgi:hypothetical protein